MFTIRNISKHYGAARSWRECPLPPRTGKSPIFSAQAEREEHAAQTMIGPSSRMRERSSLRYGYNETVGTGPRTLSQEDRMLFSRERSSIISLSLIISHCPCGAYHPRREHHQDHGQDETGAGWPSDFEELMPSQLSGGMQKRVALAGARLDPSIIFFDEPTSGLDPSAGP